VNFHPIIDWLLGWFGFGGPRHYIRLTMEVRKGLSLAMSTETKNISLPASVTGKNINLTFTVDYERDS